MSTDSEEMSSLFRDSVQRYAVEHYRFEQRAAVLRTPQVGAAIWQAYAEMGWLAMRLPAERGGIDADAPMIGALMEMAGAHLMLEPLLASTVLGTGLLLRLGSNAQRQAWLPALADGSMKLALASQDDPAQPCVLKAEELSGLTLNVLHGDIADRVLVLARDSDAGNALAVCAVEADAIDHRHCYTLIDGRGAATLRFNKTAVERLDTGDGARAIADTLDEAAIALCAEAVGVIGALLERTTEYVKLRKQFGKPIGSNQVLQHRLVDAFLLQQEARALTRAAQRSLVRPASERTRIVSGAKAYVGDAARLVANTAVQLHGGVGITDELDVSHYFRRVMVINALFGSREQHLDRFIDLSAASCGGH